MAQAPQSPGGNDNFIRRIVTDPKNVPDVMLLTGYLGASSEEAHERLYLSADLTNYVEIPNTAILHQAPLPKEQDAHGGVTLWVRKRALQYKMAPAAQALANYFAGAIQAGAQGAPGGAGAAIEPRATIGVHCATFNCSLHCATEITPCINTHANTCFCPVTHACPSQNQLCQSQGACTYVGCGASLACTQGLLCGGVAASAPPPPLRDLADRPNRPRRLSLAKRTCRRVSLARVCRITSPARLARTQHPLQCTFGCTQPPQCVVLKTAVSQCATCFINCTQAPVCLVSAFGTCNVILCGGLGPTQPPCLQNSVPPILCGGVGPGQVPPGTPVEQRQAYHSLANCSVAFCTKVPVICNPTEVTPCIL